MSPEYADEHDRKVAYEAKKSVLMYLIGIASATQGAEVWRALFAEALANIEVPNGN